MPGTDWLDGAGARSGDGRVVYGSDVAWHDDVYGATNDNEGRDYADGAIVSSVPVRV